MIRKEWLGFAAVIAAGVVIGLVAWALSPRAAEKPLPVAAGDQEVAWLHTPTSFEAWENFVWAAKRAEMTGDGGPAGLRVDDSAAFPEKTTAIPEIAIRRDGYEGTLRVRWYKSTDAMPQEVWVRALAARAPHPVAVVGGWSSDRAKTLADAMRDAPWEGPRPLLLLTAATADSVDSHDVNATQGTPLISVYDRAFRFCFTNRQMADAVTDFVLSDPTLRPGRIAPPDDAAVAALSGPAWAAMSGHPPEPVPAFAIEWRDDPYSTDLSDRFRQALLEQSRRPGRCPRLDVLRESLPFSTGRMNRPTAAEAGAVADILANLPTPGTRTLLVVPTVSAPARRTLRALVQGNPDVGRQLVAVTGDGISMNTFYRDRDFAWPVRSIKIPFVTFTHADPFAWDRRESGPAPPAGYELPPPGPGEVRSTTEDLRNFNRLIRVVSTGMFPASAARIADSPDTLAAGLRGLDPPFFEPSGDRRAGTGEHVAVIRPRFHDDPPNGRPRAEGDLEVYTRMEGEAGWVRLHSIPLGGEAARRSE